MILFFEEIHFLLQGRESLESLSVIRAALYKLFGFVVIEVYFYKLVFIGEGLALLLGQPELMQLVRVLGLVGVLEFVQSAPDELAQICEKFVYFLSIQEEVLFSELVQILAHFLAGLSHFYFLEELGELKKLFLCGFLHLLQSHYFVFLVYPENDA